jgi:hypothetical protein
VSHVYAAAKTDATSSSATSTQNVRASPCQGCR